jgi:hypothetical protein
MMDWFADQETWLSITGQLASLGLVLAQTIEDPDVLGNMQDAFNNFIQSGQVWAFGIGLVLGYMFRAFTSY